MNKTPRNPGQSCTTATLPAVSRLVGKARAGRGRPSLRTQALKEARELIQAKAREGACLGLRARPQAAKRGSPDDPAPDDFCAGQSANQPSCGRPAARPVCRLHKTKWTSWTTNG